MWDDSVFESGENFADASSSGNSRKMFSLERLKRILLILCTKNAYECLKAVGCGDLLLNDEVFVLIR